MARQRRRLSDDEKRSITERHNRGETVTRIAVAVGATYESVRRYLIRTGRRPKPPPKQKLDHWPAHLDFSGDNLDLDLVKVRR